MNNEPDARDLFNPFMLWTDLGMRAAEAAVASTQNMTEGADRLTRAAASAEVADTDEARRGDNPNTWPSASLSGVADMQRMMWDLTTRSWLQWMSIAGNLMSASAGVGVARKVARQRNPLELVRNNMEHALASPEPKPRSRKAPAKRRTANKR